MIKVLVISTAPIGLHGQSNVIMNLYYSQQNSIARFDLLAHKFASEDYIRRVEDCGGRAIVLPRDLKHPHKYMCRLSEIMKDYDAVHVHGNSATMWFEIHAAKKAGVKVRIAHSHNSSGKSKLAHHLLRPLLIRDMTLGLGCSDLSRRFAFNDKKSTVLNNCIDTDRFSYDEAAREEIRNELGIKSGEYVIGHVGNYLPVKNHEFIFSVAKVLKQRGCVARVLLLGGGGDFDAKRQMSEELGLGDTVIMAGLRSDAYRCYQAMDLFILPSLYEGFPMVLIEALTSGLECLVSDKVSRTTDIIGATRFLPIDGENAAELWADEIMREMKSKEVQDRTAAKAKIDAAGYSIKHSVEILNDIYASGNEMTACP